MRIFFACPFSRYLQIQGPTPEMCMDRTFTTFITSIEQALNEAHHQVFLAIRLEEFGAKLRPADVCTPFDMLEMQHADCVVAFPEESYGVHIELGWATAMNKPIILILKKDQSVTSPLLAGLPTVTNCRVIYVEETILSASREQEELTKQLLDALSSINVSRKFPPICTFVATNPDNEQITRAMQSAQDLKAQTHFAAIHFFGGGKHYEIATRSGLFDRLFHLHCNQQAIFMDLIPHLAFYQAVFVITRAGIYQLQDTHDLPAYLCDEVPQIPLFSNVA